MRTKQKPLEATNGQLVEMDWDIGHFPMFTYGKSRFCGRRYLGTGTGYWIFDSTAHPTYGTDFNYYLGVLKAFEDRERAGRLVYGEIREGMKTESITISLRELCSYCNVSVTGPNQKHIIETLLLLNRFTAERYSVSDGKITSIRTFKLLFFPEYVAKKGRGAAITISMLSEQREIMKAQKILISWRELQNLTQVEKAVFLYLQSNKPKYVLQQRLIRFLGVTAPSEPRPGAKKKELEEYRAQVDEYRQRRSDVAYEIKAAFIALAEKGLINFDHNTDIKQRGTAVLYRNGRLGLTELKKVGKQKIAERLKAAAKRKRVLKAKTVKGAAMALERDLEKMIPMNSAGTVQASVLGIQVEDLPY